MADYEVYDQRTNDANLLILAIETHQAVMARTPRLVAADAGFYSAKNEAAAKAKGAKRVCIPIAPPRAPRADPSSGSVGSASASSLTT